MRRVHAFVFAGALALAVFAVPVATASAAGFGKESASSLCTSRFSTCADPFDEVNGTYVGHDEPSVEFKSNAPGSGNDMTYVVTLPKDPRQKPNAAGIGGSTWNFQLRPTFWFGVTLCDSQSAPEFTHVCHGDTDANNLTSTNPNSPNYLGKHPGTAFLELQFYGPGYVPQFEGFGCTATQYCAAMTIDSFTTDLNNGVSNTSACDNFVLGGAEPTNWAYITTSGVSQAPANPLFTGTVDNPNFTAVNPDPMKDLLMSPGDRIRIHMHDTPAGYQADLTDLTSGGSGSMTASTKNGFGHILYTPNSTNCHEAPYAFHAAYSTANVRGNVWTAHTYNVAMSDEIGHFENCLAIDAAGNCTQAGGQDGKLDQDDIECVPGADSTVVKIDGCFFDDEDFDGQSYQQDWPGTNPNPAVDASLHPTPLVFTSPTTAGKQYPTIAFETDLPGIEQKGAQFKPPFCNPKTGSNCVNPPRGAAFYPFFSNGFKRGTCVWQEGGDFIPGTTNDFGGSSSTEFGGLLKTVFPSTGFTTESTIENFNSGDMANPCPSG